MDGCCFYQAKRCDDDTLANVWIRKTEVPAKPIYFEITAASGTRYYIPSDAVATPCPGTVYAIALVTIYEDCSETSAKVCDCCFSTGATPSFTLPTLAALAGRDAVYADLATANNNFAGVYTQTLILDGFGTPIGIHWDGYSDEAVDGSGFRFRWHYQIEYDCISGWTVIVSVEENGPEGGPGNWVDDGPDFNRWTLQTAGAVVAFQTCCGFQWDSADFTSATVDFSFTAGTTGTATIINNTACVDPEGNCQPGNGSPCDGSGINTCPEEPM